MLRQQHDAVMRRRGLEEMVVDVCGSSDEKLRLWLLHEQLYNTYFGEVHKDATILPQALGNPGIHVAPQFVRKD